MIRHSSSFFFSLILHTLLATALFYAYKSVVKPDNNQEKEKVEMKLCCIVEKVPEPKPIKKIIPKPKPKKKQIVEKKVIPKKVVIVKDAPKIKEEPKPQEVKVVEEEKVEITEVEEKVIEPREFEPVQVENLRAKKQRLESEYMGKHIKEIARLLRENLYYPRSARKRGIVGKVIVKFKLSVDAESHSIEVISAKSKILSRAAIKTVQDLSGEFPKPSEELSIHVPINYSLN